MKLEREFAPRLRRIPPSKLSPRAGCQCKVGGIHLEEILEEARERSDCERKDNSFAEIEDCAFVKIGREHILANLDLAPLPFPELFSAGRISALHAFSDVYARGGNPLFAMAALIVPTMDSHEDASIVLAGAMRACAEDGASLVHGQTIYGNELMLGIAVLGAPATGILRGKHGCRDGDLVMLSKAIGTGLAVKSFQLGILSFEELAETQVLMECSNRNVCRAIANIEVHACTDVSGFGLLGHLSEMLSPGQGAAISVASVPVLKVLKDLPPLIAESIWIRSNRDYSCRKAKLVGYNGCLSQKILFDPQTNGGLLVAASPSNRKQLELAGFCVIGAINSTNVIELT